MKRGIQSIQGLETGRNAAPPTCDGYQERMSHVPASEPGQGCIACGHDGQVSGYTFVHQTREAMIASVLTKGGAATWVG